MSRLIILLFLFISGCISKQDTEINALCDKCKIVGASYAVFTSNHIIEKGVYGIKRINSDTSFVKLTDRFHIASNTKAITALIAAKLVEQNKINWTTKFFDVFPSLKANANNYYWNITFQDLLCHRAHIQPYLNIDGNNDDYKFNGTIQQQRKQFCIQVLNQPPVFADAGKTYVYSNAGIVLAASMMEQVTDMSWEQLVNKYLYQTLKLPFEVGFPNQTNSNEPWGHISEGGTATAVSPTNYKMAMVLAPAGDLNVDIGNYIKLIQLFMRGYEGQNNFVKSNTYKYLLTAMPDYSFGWMRKTEANKIIDFHYGNDGIFCCYIEYDLTDGITSVIFTNCVNATSVDDLERMSEYLINKQLKEKSQKRTARMTTESFIIPTERAGFESIS